MVEKCPPSLTHRYKLILLIFQKCTAFLKTFRYEFVSSPAFMSDCVCCVTRVNFEWFHGYQLWFATGLFPSIGNGLGETTWLLVDAVKLGGLISKNRGQWLAGSKVDPRSVSLPAGSLPSLQVVGGPRFAALAKHPVVLLTRKGLADLRKLMAENPKASVPSPLPAPAASAPMSLPEFEVRACFYNAYSSFSGR